MGGALMQHFLFNYLDTFHAYNITFFCKIGILYALTVGFVPSPFMGT